MFLAIAGVAAAQPKTGASIAQPRIVTVSNTSLPVIRVCVHQATMFEFPKEENLMITFLGDEADFVLNTAKNPSPYLDIEPKDSAVGMHTNLHIVTDKNNASSFSLQEVSGKAGESCDSKIIVEESGQNRQNNLHHAAAWVLASDADRYKKEAREANDKLAQQEKEAQAKAASAINSFRASYPGRLHFDYEWDKKQGAKFNVHQIYNDGVFTRILADPTDTPAFYEGKVAITNFDYANGVYTIYKVIDSGYLQIGKSRMKFWRKGGKG